MRKYRHILCATDFSDQCSVAAERAVEFARLYGAQLTLLHVVEHFPVDRSNLDIAPEDIDPVQYHEEKALRALRVAAGKLKFDKVRLEVRFSMTSARDAILKFIAKHRVDLVVIASHGCHGFATARGSTTLGTTDRSPCDVLIVHTDSS